MTLAQQVSVCSAGCMVAHRSCSPLRRARYALIGVLVAVLATGGCSIRRYAVNTIGDVLASGARSMRVMMISSSSATRYRSA